MEVYCGFSGIFQTRLARLLNNTTSHGKSACASLYMEGNERNTCRESVFQIFRAHGHGDVRVGGVIGLYLTREKWEVA